MIGRVLRGAGGAYLVLVGDEELSCSLRGRIKQGEGSIAVGDRVDVEQLEDGSCRIDSVLPRQSVLSRRSFAKRKEQVLAANVDQVAAVVATARPELDPFLLDRLLAVAELNDLSSFIICNKCELSESDDLPELLQPYSDAGYDVLQVSAKTGEGMEALREQFAGRITVLAGASGVGKSSIVNARSGRGRHTTTAGLLIPLGGDSFLADTPGVQNFEPAALEPGELPGVFREFRPYLDDCRFADFRHRDEPGCAVREAVNDHRLSARRHESYLALLATAEQASRPWNRRGP